MADQNSEHNQSPTKNRLMWALLALLVIVVVLAILALRSPISEPIGERTMVPTLVDTPSIESLTETPQPEVIVLGPEDFLDPEEIGHTEGIIFWSTVLLIIVIVGTLRETILRKKSPDEKQ
jgi:hypothetical protein